MQGSRNVVAAGTTSRWTRLNAGRSAAFGVSLGLHLGLATVLTLRLPQSPDVVPDLAVTISLTAPGVALDGSAVRSEAAAEMAAVSPPPPAALPPLETGSSVPAVAGLPRLEHGTSIAAVEAGETPDSEQARIAASPASPEPAPSVVTPQAVMTETPGLVPAVSEASVATATEPRTAAVKASGTAGEPQTAIPLATTAATEEPPVEAAPANPHETHASVAAAAPVAITAAVDPVAPSTSRPGTCSRCFGCSDDHDPTATSSAGSGARRDGPSRADRGEGSRNSAFPTGRRHAVLASSVRTGNRRPNGGFAGRRAAGPGRRGSRAAPDGPNLHRSLRWRRLLLHGTCASPHVGPRDRWLRDGQEQISSLRRRLQGGNRQRSQGGGAMDLAQAMRHGRLPAKRKTRIARSDDRARPPRSTDRRRSLGRHRRLRAGADPLVLDLGKRGRRRSQRSGPGSWKARKLSRYRFAASSKEDPIHNCSWRSSLRVRWRRSAR